MMVRRLNDATPEEWDAASSKVMQTMATQLGTPAEWQHPATAPAAPQANAVQVGGTHYKALRYETWDVINDWGLGYLDGNAVKYLSRWRKKGGIEDLRKARHYIDKLIETEIKNANPNP